jgi:hypothetical protein
MVDHHAQLSTEPPVCGQQGIAGLLGAHLAIAQDEVREDGAHGFARDALEAPDGEPTQADTGVMGVARQAPAAATGGRMCELKAKGEDKGEDTLDKRLAIGKQTKVDGRRRRGSCLPVIEWCE